MSITKLLNIYFIKKVHSFLFSFNTLYFYLSQGCLFTLFSFYNFNNALSIVFVFCFSHLLSHYLIRLEKFSLTKLEMTKITVLVASLNSSSVFPICFLL